MWENLYNVLEDYAVAVRNKYQDKLIIDNKIATGELLNSIDYIIQKDERSIEVSLRMEDYWKYVEDGRQAGKFPPIDKIRDWIRIKPILPKEGKDGKLPTEKQLAFLISRKIALEGIEAGHQLRDTISDLKEQWDALIEEAITKDIQNDIDILFTQAFSS